MRKDVTMRDIARELNISAVSVSKAISGKDGVSDIVRDRILNKAREMGYIYTTHAPTVNLHYNFGVLVSQAYISDNAFYSRLFQNLSMEFAKSGHSCSLEIMDHRDESEGRIPENVSFKRVDGIIVLGPVSKLCVDKIIKIDLPCLFLDNYTPDANMDCVVSDNVYGAYTMTDHLIGKGFKKIAFVGTVNATNSITDRYLGYIKSLLQNGIPQRPDYVLPDRDPEGNLLEIQIPEDLPEAFVCNCDETAYHFMEQLRKKNIRVPEDVSVVGFDDYIFATLSNPGITTFRVNMEEMCKSAAEIMLKKMKDPGSVTGRRVISGEIIIRGSVKE